jgi:ribonuclease HI
MYCDGAGARPDGSGAGFAWLRVDTGQQRVERAPQGESWTNNEAEYRGLLSAVESLSPGSRAEIFTDSELVAYQFAGRYKVRDWRLGQLLEQARKVIAKRRLAVEVRWIPRGKNQAGKLI